MKKKTLDVEYFMLFGLKYNCHKRAFLIITVRTFRQKGEAITIAETQM